MKTAQRIIGSSLSVGALALTLQITAMAQTNTPATNAVVQTNVVVVQTNMVVQPVPPPEAQQKKEKERFHGGEIDLSPFGLYVDRAGGKWGGGAALTFYLLQDLGIGASTFITDTKGTFFDNVEGEGYFRLPLLDLVAPYAVAGFGYQFDHDYSFETVGLGVDFRPFKNFSAFTDAQYLVSNNHDKSKNAPFVRLGLRFNF